jgi:integrase
MVLSSRQCASRSSRVILWKLPALARAETDAHFNTGRGCPMFRYQPGHRLYPLFYLAMSAGLRCGELLALQWADIQR